MHPRQAECVVWQGLMTNMLNKSIQVAHDNTLLHVAHQPPQVAQDNNFSHMCADTSTESVAKVASNLGFDPVASVRQHLPASLDPVTSHLAVQLQGVDV